MELNVGLLGTPLKTHQTTINWRDTTNYAASVQDDNPEYFDDSNETGIVAHPMFAVSVTWPVLSRLDTFIESTDFPKEVLMTQVHYTEHLILNRLIRPGDELTISGTLKALLPHRAGTHAMICLEARDQQGEMVFTEYAGALLRGVACGEGCKADPLPVIPKNDAGGEIIWASHIPIDPLRPYVYDGCSNIVFPIHTSPAFARMVGLPGIILQGTATLAYAIREVVNREAGKDPARISEIACRFTGMVLPGTEIRVCCTGRNSHNDVTNIFFEVQNGDQQKAVHNGYVKVLKG